MQGELFGPTKKGKKTSHCNSLALFTRKEPIKNRLQKNIYQRKGLFLCIQAKYGITTGTILKNYAKIMRSKNQIYLMSNYLRNATLMDPNSQGFHANPCMQPYDRLISCIQLHPWNHDIFAVHMSPCLKSYGSMHGVAWKKQNSEKLKFSFFEVDRLFRKTS